MHVYQVADVLRWVDLSGVFANALLGGVIARREKLDPIGFIVLAIMSGLGGGLIRDVLLDVGPPAAFLDNAYLWTAFAGAGVSYLVHLRGRWWNISFTLIDALALGAWSAAGATKALMLGLGWLPAIMIGTIAAVGGGMIRDITLRRVPGVLGGNTLYATCAAAASAIAVFCTHAGYFSLALVAGMVSGGGLCLLARWRGWVLPEADAWSWTGVIPSFYRERMQLRAARRRHRRDVVHKGQHHER
ncbi:MAG: trimeric intracellular cation channel family protein [Propionibacteriaceae bacterium]